MNAACHLIPYILLSKQTTSPVTQTIHINHGHMVNNGMEYGCIDVEMRLYYHLRHYVGVEFRWPSAGAAFLKVSEVREASEAFLDVNHVEVQQKWYKLMT